MNRREWARKIKESWKLACTSAIASFLQTGRDLINAKDELEHGEWLKLVGSQHDAGELPFQKRVAQTLMAIASNPFLQKRSNAALLPPDFTTLYALERLHRRFPDTF